MNAVKLQSRHICILKNCQQEKEKKGGGGKYDDECSAITAFSSRSRGFSFFISLCSCLFIVLRKKRSAMKERTDSLKEKKKSSFSPVKFSAANERMDEVWKTRDELAYFFYAEWRK